MVVAKHLFFEDISVCKWCLHTIHICAFSELRSGVDFPKKLELKNQWVQINSASLYSAAHEPLR
jgi:hypothetical protein